MVMEVVDNVTEVNYTYKHMESDAFTVSTTATSDESVDVRDEGKDVDANANDEDYRVDEIPMVQQMASQEDEGFNQFLAFLDSPSEPVEDFVKSVEEKVVSKAPFVPDLAVEEPMPKMKVSDVDNRDMPIGTLNDASYLVVVLLFDHLSNFSIFTVHILKP